MSRKKRIIGLLAAGALAVTACGMSGIMAAANETGREETMRAEDTYTFELSSQVERRPVRYKNRYGIELSADMYLPKDMEEGRKYPAVVIGAPYGGVKEQGPGVYANALAQRGFVALAFDPSFNGTSGGEPRHVSSPEIFTEGFSAGVDYLGTWSFVDRNQIGAVGICGSGGFALSAAQVDTRIKAVVTASLVDISSNGDAMSPEERTALLEQISEQRWADFEQGEPEYVPVYPDEPQNAVPEGLDPMSAEFYSYYGLERGNHPNADGAFTTTSQMPFLNYKLLEHLETISPRPVLMLAGENAMSRGLTEGVYERLGEAKELMIIPGANHVDLYDRTDLIPFDRIESFLLEAFAG